VKSIYRISGGLDKPSARFEGIPQVVEPAGFDVRSLGYLNILETFGGVSNIGQPHLSGFRLKPGDLPKVVRICDADHIVDFDSNGTMFFVSQRARGLIERLEPGMHQFEPVAFVDPSGSKLADMFVFVIAQRLDTMDRERTNMILSKAGSWTWAKNIARWYPDYDLTGVDVEAAPREVFSLVQIGDAALWRDQHITGPAFASQAFVDAFVQGGLKGLAKVAVEEVSE